MADTTTPPPDDEQDPAAPGTIRGSRPTVPAGFSPGPDSTRRGDVPMVGSGFGPGPSGTARSTGPTVASGFGPSPGGLGAHLPVGSDVTLNGEIYRVDRLISAATGEADVYLLQHGDQPAVLKLYYANYQPKADVLAPLKQLRHDDILNLIDYGQFQGRFFEVMEYAAGGTVEEHLPLRDPRQLRALIAECVNALRFCHDRGIVHKDIKPGNLFYKKAGQTDLALGDFGISSMLAAGVSRHLTSQSLTVGYAAPEMYGIDGKVYVGREVDYYALGVTLLHLWVGRSPFEGLGVHAIANLTVTGAIALPADLPKDLQTLVRGLTTIDFTHRWGFAEVQRWLNGEDVPVHVQATAPAFPPFKFGFRGDEAATPEALAVLLKAQPEVGKKSLYTGKISAWVNVFDHARASVLDTIVEDEYPQAQDVGLQKAIYVLDPDQPYESDRRQCRTTPELAAALEDGFSFYGPLLKNPHHAFYLYLEAHGAKKEADTFRQYFQTFSAKKALNATILALAGTASVRILGRDFFSPEEVLAARGQSAVVDLLKDPESRLSLWMEGTATPAVRARLEAWRALEIRDATTLAYVSENAGGVPKLDLAPSRVSLSDLRPRSTSGGSFEVRNLGEGQLTGSISVDQPWLTLMTTTLDPHQKTQTVAFTVDTAGFPFGTTASATIAVQTNVGRATVTADLAMEQGATAVARFRRQATAAAVAIGAVVGWAIYAISTAVGAAPPSTLAGLLGLAGLGWCVSNVYQGAAERTRNILAATGGALLLILISEASAPALSSSLSWAVLFGSVSFGTAPFLLRTLQQGLDRRLVISTIAVCATVLGALTIFVDLKISERGRRQPSARSQEAAATAPRDEATVESSGSDSDSSARGAMAPTPTIGAPRWPASQAPPLNVGALPVAAGLGDTVPRISTLVLLDVEKRPVPYRVQYVPFPYLSYVADHLRARKPVELRLAPEGFPGAESTVTVAEGATVRVVEAFTDVEAPSGGLAERNFDMFLPFSDNAKPYSISKGTAMVVVHNTRGECPTFFLSTLEFRGLCWPESEVPLKGFAAKGAVRTAFLLKLEDGRTAWTPFINEDGPPESWLAGDWITCHELQNGASKTMYCNP